jgi:hypothetical protein
LCERRYNANYRRNFQSTNFGRRTKYSIEAALFWISCVPFKVGALKIFDPINNALSSRLLET